MCFVFSVNFWHYSICSYLILSKLIFLIAGEGTTDIKPVDMVPSNSPNFRVTNLQTEWAGLAPKYVKVGLYKDNNEVGFVVFNGVGSDIKNWFAADKLLASRWPNMTPTSTYNIFSIDGDVRSTLQRRFLISSAYAGCPKDIGYLAVIEKEGVCVWDKHASYPQFVYAKDNTHTTWALENFDRADYMAIFISS